MAQIALQIPEAAVPRLTNALSKYSDATTEPTVANAKAGLVALIIDYVVQFERKRLQLETEASRSQQETAITRPEGLA